MLRKKLLLIGLSFLLLIVGCEEVKDNKPNSSKPQLSYKEKLEQTYNTTSAPESKKLGVPTEPISNATLNIINNEIDEFGIMMSEGGKSHSYMSKRVEYEAYSQTLYIVIYFKSTYREDFIPAHCDFLLEIHEKYADGYFLKVSLMKQYEDGSQNTFLCYRSYRDTM